LPLRPVAIGIPVLLLLLAGTYGIAQPLRFGHFGWHAAEHGFGASNLMRFGMLGLTTYNGVGPPATAAQNFHHPTMLELPVALLQLLLGTEPWTVRMVGLALVVMVVVSLYAFVRRARGEATATAAAVVFVSNPFVVSYSNLPQAQPFSIGMALITALLLLDLLERPTVKLAAALVACATLGALSDWVYYPVAFCFFLVTAGHAVARVRRGELSGSRARLVAWSLGLASLAVLCVLAQHFLRAAHAGALDDLLDAYRLRSTQGTLGDFAAFWWSRVTYQHTHLLLLGFVGWAAVSLATRRRDMVVHLVIALMIGALLFDLKFQRTFREHEYRCYWLAPVFALAVADAAIMLGRAAAARVQREPLRVAATWAPLVLVCAFLLSRALPMAVFSRQTSGSTQFLGYTPRTDLMMAAHAIATLAPPNAVVAIDPSARRLEVRWNVRRPSTEGLGFPGRKDAWLLMRRDTVEKHSSLHERIRRAGVVAVGDWLVIDPRPPAGSSFEAVRVVEQRTYGALERWLRAPAKGPRVFIRRPAADTASLARSLGEPAAVVARAARGDGPMFARLRGLSFHD
jgi:hypothetical protein